MSTLFTTHTEKCDLQCRQRLRQFVVAPGAVSYLLRPEQLAERLTLLDNLDAMIGGLDLEAFITCGDARIISHANALKTQLEAANEKQYESARSEITLEGHSRMLHRWLRESTADGRVRGLRPGLGFDLRDEIVSGILQLREPSEMDLPRSSEMVFYQPTPARHILDLIRVSRFSTDDTLIDLGSGLGHVPLLVSILTGNRTLGVEFQPAYVASAQESAQNLNLRGVRFVAEDARGADLSSGTVFYLFSPFKGSILTDVLHKLRMESRDRQIRICSLGPCTRVLEDQTWLKSTTQVDTERITIFESQ